MRTYARIPAFLLAIALPGVAAERPIAAKPPLGWNSFDSYGVYLHEKAAMANLESMAQSLAPYRYGAIRAAA
jgi:hypothetical protein